MVDAASIASAASSLSSAGTILRTLLGMKIDHEVRNKIAELQAEIIAAQSAALLGIEERARLVAAVASLEARIRDAASWKDETDRYRLTKFPTGAQVYQLREESADGEPSHTLCPNCFTVKRKSILQTYARHGGGEAVECPACKLRLILQEFPRAEVRSAGPRTDYGGYSL